ncbi:MAG: hypothetical protein RLZZ127_2215 [Planctomycetota bacterium]
MPLPHRRRLPSERIAEVGADLRERPVVVAELYDRLGANGPFLLAIIMTVPFLSPVPAAGLSTPFGLGIASIGLYTAWHRRPRLPGFLARRELPAGFLGRLLTWVAKPLGWLERLTRPRHRSLVAPGPARVASGLVVAVLGVLLAMPLPVPFSNALPSYGIVLLCMGWLCRDGLMAMLGWLMFAVTILFFTAIGIAAWLGVSWGWSAAAGDAADPGHSASATAAATATGASMPSASSSSVVP